MDFNRDRAVERLAERLRAVGYRPDRLDPDTRQNARKLGIVLLHPGHPACICEPPLMPAPSRV